MKGLWSLTAICAALLFVSVCVGLMTAGPAIAQGGPRPSDVRVTNTAAEAIPTTITNVPAVQVNSLPAVQVSSLPAVQVGNTAGSPVPVTVTNLPSAGGQPMPVTIRADVPVPGDGFFGQIDAYTVPAGKLFVAEHFTYNVNRFDSTTKHRVQVNYQQGGVSGFLTTAPQGDLSGASFNPLIYSDQCRFYADPETTIRATVTKNNNSGSPNSTAFTNLTLTGYLVDAP